MKTRLFQEDLWDRPFHMMIACCLVNRTRWKVAEPVFREVVSRWPTPSDLAGAPGRVLKQVLRPIGLGPSRTRSLRDIATAWIKDPPSTSEDVTRIPGLGRYAADSWAIFVDGRSDVTPSDSRLKTYLMMCRRGG